MFNSSDEARINAWLANQKTMVLNKLKRLAPKDDQAIQFVAVLSKYKQVVGGPETLQLLFEAWLAVPSEVFFAFACGARTGELKQLTDVASQALLTVEDVHEFELLNQASDPRDEVLGWLRNRAIYNKPR